MARRKLTRGRARKLDRGSTASREVSRSSTADSGRSSDGRGEGERLFEDGIAQLYADDSVALATWKDRLSQYVDGQGSLDALRLRSSSEQPWPAFDNPMLGYLIERSIEMAHNDGIDEAVRWLATNSWFEGAIAERSRFVRLLDAD